MPVNTMGRTGGAVYPPSDCCDVSNPKFFGRKRTRQSAGRLRPALVSLDAALCALYSVDCRRSRQNRELELIHRRALPVGTVDVGLGYDYRKNMETGKTDGDPRLFLRWQCCQPFTDSIITTYPRLHEFSGPTGFGACIHHIYSSQFTRYAARCRCTDRRSTLRQVTERVSRLSGSPNLKMQ